VTYSAFVHDTMEGMRHIITDDVWLDKRIRFKDLKNETFPSKRDHFVLCRFPNFLGGAFDGENPIFYKKKKSQGKLVLTLEGVHFHVLFLELGTSVRFHLKSISI